MKFNELLLEEIPDKDRELAQVVLFAIDRNLRLDLYFTNQTTEDLPINDITWREDILGDVQDIVRLFVKNEIIEENYNSDRICRYKLLRSLYVSGEIKYAISDEIVEGCRNYFKKQYCGISDRNAPSKTVKQHLTMLIEKHPELDVVQLPNVCRYVVDMRKKENMLYVPNILNFINSEGDKTKETKDLVTYYEEYLDEGEQLGEQAGGNFVD
jgi:hypothetical protein